MTSKEMFELLERVCSAEHSDDFMCGLFAAGVLFSTYDPKEDSAKDRKGPIYIDTNKRTIEYRSLQ